MTETTDRQTDLRALDRDIALLLGWEYYPEGDYRWLPPDCLPVNECPAYSSTWEGFGLLVEECEKRGWVFCSYGSPGLYCVWVGLEDDIKPISPSNSYKSAGIRHAFALAMRDALKAARGAQG